ncbi:succinate dehydrogenase assembly factor [Starmerella bacillaris]|uniref:Succinate dehydrogenase assembly factor 2, mitochondrial n=1 Tax=Starmerella bacillaris TaxID=1247836 RepID=A0AAV5RIE3_STABA|nr:succinate dehydrogenase assembly factor [Starmerella bacillaris]
MIRSIVKSSSFKLIAPQLQPRSLKFRCLHNSIPSYAKIEPSVSSKTLDSHEVRLEPAPRPNESIENKRARLLWQSRKRGILETCVILGKFAQEYLPTLSVEELEDYDKFMNENDWDIYYWITETENPPKPCPEFWKTRPVFEKLKKVGRNENNEIMRQPNLY